MFGYRAEGHGQKFEVIRIEKEGRFGECTQLGIDPVLKHVLGTAPAHSPSLPNLFQPSHPFPTPYSQVKAGKWPLAALALADRRPVSRTEVEGQGKCWPWYRGLGRHLGQAAVMHLNFVPKRLTQEAMLCSPWCLNTAAVRPEKREQQSQEWS